MLTTMPNSITPMPQALPDASDNASSIVGYNINNYVFGDLNGTDTYSNQTQQLPNNQTTVTTANKNKKSNPLFGIIGLLGLAGLGYFGLKKAKGQNINLPKFETIKTRVLDFFKKFKKPTP